jgi:hypothetical protein
MMKTDRELHELTSTSSCRGLGGAEGIAPPRSSNAGRDERQAARRSAARAAAAFTVRPMASGFRSRAGRMTLEQEYRLLYTVFGSFFLLVACVIVLLPFRSDRNQGTIALILLLPPLAATGAGPIVAAGAAVLTALVFNVFFTQPYNSPRIDSGASVAAFVAYLAVAVTASVVVARRCEALALAERRETEATVLQALTVELFGGGDLEPVLGLLCERLGLRSARVARRRRGRRAARRRPRAGARVVRRDPGARPGPPPVRELDAGQES